MSLRKDVPRVLARIPVVARHGCVFCGEQAGRFLSYREGQRGSSSLIRILGLVASDVDNFECPKCGAHDREQPLLLLEVAGLLSLMLGTRILHFAPERYYERS